MLITIITSVCFLNFVLQAGYPAKLKKVLIVTAPLWFKAPFKILRLFVREKLRDRVYTVSIPQVRHTNWRYDGSNYVLNIVHFSYHHIPI